MVSIRDTVRLLLELRGAYCWTNDDRDDVLFFRGRGKNLPEIHVVLQFSGTLHDPGPVYMYSSVAEGVEQQKHELAMRLCNELAWRYFWVTFFLDPETDNLFAKSTALLTPGNYSEQTEFALSNLIGVIDEQYPIFQKYLLSGPDGAAEETEGGE